ncbi:MAG: hypothetical protein GF411_12905 [Candidatus Lokiarchaeota archaeon]|nr:hypothetical protein [Candidatus Lokiarchaeota archaeon]
MNLCKSCNRDMGVGEDSTEYCEGVCVNCYGKTIKYKCSECGTLFYEKDKVPTCCNKAFHNTGNDSLVRIQTQLPRRNQR